MEGLPSMLRALLGAQHDAVLPAEISPSPSGFLPTPLFPIPTSPLGVFVSWCLGVVVILENQDTPLHPPSGRGDKRRRQAKKKGHVEYWRELLAYVDAAYRKRFGRHYPWNNLARKNLWNLARGYSSWEVMALWDLYLESESWWALKTVWAVYGMIREAQWLMDNPRVKQLAINHEEQLIKRGSGRLTQPNDLFNCLFPRSACKLQKLGIR